MKKLVIIALFFLALVVLPDCKDASQTKRVQITKEVSVIMPWPFEKIELNNGQILFKSSVGSTDLLVTVLKDMSMEKITTAQLKDGMEINVARFLEPRNGTLLHRKDTIMGGVVRSDFEFEVVNLKVSKSGVGRFIIKGNHFIGFLCETLKPEPKTNKAIQESFFNSIQID